MTRISIVLIVRAVAKMNMYYLSSIQLDIKRKKTIILKCLKA